LGDVEFDVAHDDDAADTARSCRLAGYIERIYPDPISSDFADPPKRWAGFPLLSASRASRIRQFVFLAQSEVVAGVYKWMHFAINIRGHSGD
jgi:hypothetical protein